jgi:hypothetical protein
VDAKPEVSEPLLSKHQTWFLNSSHFF